MAESKVLFDKQDYEIMHLVNQVLERLARSPSDFAQKMLEPGFHPHGLKELALSYDKRIAYSVINLLESLELGLPADRLAALESLHDEVMYGTMTSFRYNTGRLLVQIMKDMVRSRGDEKRQLRLAHDFRAAIGGRRRIVRGFLRRYKLLEMPENRAQLAFDGHVHDSGSKGRKSPTHLILDAWIKGIRSLTVIYYNYVRPETVCELMQSAATMDIQVKIGVEYKARFRGRYISLIWQPLEFADASEMSAFLQEKKTARLMQMGEDASRYYSSYVLKLLDNYNQVHAKSLSAIFGMQFEPVSQEEFLSFVSPGQPSVMHLAELVYKKALPGIKKRYAALLESREAALNSPESLKYIDEMLEAVRSFDGAALREHWLAPEMNGRLDPFAPADLAELPRLMRFGARGLTALLTNIRPSSQINLNLEELSVEDVLEVLYDCQGRITHLELFNLKNFKEGSAGDMRAVNALQLAINRGSSLLLKRRLLAMLAHAEESGDQDHREKLSEILHNIDKLHNFYSIHKLRCSIGSDSVDRLGQREAKHQGMGFACMETLPRRARSIVNKEADDPESGYELIPLVTNIDAIVTYSARKPGQARGLFRRELLRQVPLLSQHFYRQRYDWKLRSDRIRYAEEGNICTLGGIQRDTQPVPWHEEHKAPLGESFSYINNPLWNVTKVLIGFSAAMLTFMYTQSWLVLMFFGAPIWFGITGIRNIAQAVLGAGGARRSPMLRWNNFISWRRLCDSLLYTGLSVPLLELVTRVWLLQKGLGITPDTHQWIFYGIMSAVNGAYIVAHNIYRGFPASAVVGNIFRSALAIPVAVVFNQIAALVVIKGFGSEPAILLQMSSITSKMASDTVAGVIEGLADRGVNIQARLVDYKVKLNTLFNTFTRLELHLPEDSAVLNSLALARDGSANKKAEEPASGVKNTQWRLEQDLIIDALDLMYFWFYLPRARQVLIHLLDDMSREEREIFFRTQYILKREKEVTILLINGVLGPNFAKPLAFYLAEVDNYFKELKKLRKGFSS